MAQPKQLSLVKATEFEYRHQTLVHQLIIGAAFLTYLVDREDVVWRLVKNTAIPHTLERFVFIVATIFVAIGVGFCTWGRAHRYPRYLGELCYAIGLGSLVPVGGFVILVGGEALRVFRLIRRHAQDSQQLALSVARSLSRPSAEETNRSWRKAFRHEAVKWGILVTMIVFVITLKDRYAEFLAVASFLVGTLFNLPVFSPSNER